jgi:hypothetical protein
VYQHPAVLEALVRDRVVERRHPGVASRRSRRDAGRYRVTEAARRGTGWLLVEWGLRLAMPRGAVVRPVARGQR